MSEEILVARPSLIRKLCEVMVEVEKIPRRGKNPHFGYSYATEADVSDALRKALGKRGVFLSHHVTAVHEKDIPTRASGSQTITRLDLTYTFHDADSAEKLSFCTIGEGMDGGDKGAYKALTGGLKYALMKSFLIATEDDPEADPETDKIERVPAFVKKVAQDAPANEAPDMATQKQIKFIWALAKKAGMEEAAIRQWLADKFGAGSSKELTKDMASEAIKELQTLQPEDVTPF